MAQTFIIDPTSIDINQLNADIRNFIDTAPDAEAWIDFFNSSQGVFIEKLLGGASAFFNYNTIVARREAFIRHVENRSSAIGIGQNLGFSAFRGENAKLKLTVTPNTTGVLLKNSTIGSVKDQDLILLADTVVSNGIQVDLNVVVGLLKNEEITIATDKAALFRFTKDKVSDDITLKLNAVEVGTSARALDAPAPAEKFVAQSNPFGSVDVFYLNKVGFTVRYEIGDTLSLDWVELKDLTFVDSDIEFDFGVLNVIETTSVFADRETTASIKLNAPIFHETEFVIRAREDFAKEFKLLDTTIIDTDFIDISPSVIDLVALRNDLSLFTPAQKASLITQLDGFKSMGLQPPTISDPFRVPLTLKIDVTLLAAAGDIITQVTTIVQARAKKLKQIIEFDDLENEIEKLVQVKVARLSIKSNVWTADTKFNIKEYVKPTVDNGRVYRAIKILHFSAGSEPSFPTGLGAVGDLIIDNDVVWEAKLLERQCDPENPELPIIPPRDIWVADRAYDIGDIIIPTSLDILEFIVVDFINKSNATEPIWPTLSGGTPNDIKGSLKEDGDILWFALPLSGTPATWTANTNFKQGDTVVATDPSASDTIGVMFQALQFLGTTDSSEPTFPTTLLDTVVDNNILWEANDPKVDPTNLAFNEYYIITEDVTAT